MDTIKYRPFLVAGLIALFSLFALWLRLLPLFTRGNTDIISMVAMDDPFYNLRQVELILAHFPQYGWFDTMTHYPVGTTIYWGPLFPLIIAVCCLITGAITRPEIIGTALLVTPLMAAVIVVLMYFVGKAFGDWKTGVLASGFTAVVTGQFFTVSWYGYIDHHIAEVLFSTLFCLLYSYAIQSAKDTPIDPACFSSYKKTLLLSLIAGGGYLLGLFTMPTMILFAMIVWIFTIIQFIIDIYRNRTSEYLLIINSTVFLTAIVGLMLFGLKDTGIGLSTYSIGHIYAYIGLTVGTAVLYALAHALRGKERWYYPMALLGSAALVVVILAVASPQIYALFISSPFAFFGQQVVTDTVLEARGWSFDQAWQSLNYGLILFAGGALVLLYNNGKDEHPHQIFALI
ncbi:MAG: STT3 domain-containing protein [Methanoregula sp.]|jgi:dolichyl-diphosphooligosaccharide--protein glycosyltransferase